MAVRVVVARDLWEDQAAAALVVEAEVAAVVALAVVHQDPVQG